MSRRIRIATLAAAVAAVSLVMPARRAAGEEQTGVEDRKETKEAKEKGPMLAHMVYFELAENTDETFAKLVAGCKKHLSGHDGTVHFSVGRLAEDLARDVNDRGFQVSLNLIFESKAAHDRYQTHERHLEFIETCKHLWKTVRVFDSYLVSGPAGPVKKKEPGKGDGVATDAKARIPLPDAATGFAGMVRGKVVSRRGADIVLEVEEVTRSWEHSKAPDAKAMVGKPIRVVAPKAAESSKSISRLFKRLRVGESVTLDVAHESGEALVIKELTDEQRARAK